MSVRPAAFIAALCTATAALADGPDSRHFTLLPDQEQEPDAGALATPAPPRPVEPEPPPPVLLVSPPPSEEPPRPVPQFRGRVEVTVDTLFDGKNLAAVGEATGTLYLQKLTDTPETPLALQTFIQHPSLLKVIADKTFGGGAGALAADIFIVDDTSVSALLGASYEPATNGRTISAIAGLSHYFLPGVRGALGYVGSRFYASPGYSATDGVRALLALYAHPIMIQLRLEAALSEPATVIVTPRVDAFYSVTRQLGVSALVGGSWVTLSNAALPNGHRTISSEFIGVGLDFYVTDWLDLTGGWTLVFRQIPSEITVPNGTPFNISASLMHDFSVGAAIRL